MTKKLFIGDIHAGTNRSVGTTVESVRTEEVKKLETLSSIIKETKPDIVYILGDICDKRVIPDWLKVELINRLDIGIKVIILAGNHDFGGIQRFDQMCSLELIDKLSSANITVVLKEPQLIYGIYCLPHQIDQNLFDRCIEKVPPNVPVLLHCNIISNFSESEHSLNICKTQIDKLIEQGNIIIAGHEHNHRKLFGYKLVVVGCIRPTSISDVSTDKFVMTMEDNKTEFIKVWDRNEEYIKVDWTELHKIKNQSIIEVTGDVSIDESVEANKAVAELRKNSTAYIVKNSVKVMNKDIDITSEDVTNFNIVDIFKRALDEETRNKLEEILNEK